jgi:hypothetical protein
MRRAVAAAVLVLGVLAPRLAAACPSCISSAYGDRTYNWAYIGLLLMPFLVGVVIAGILAWNAGYRLDRARLRRLVLRTPFARLPHFKETT